MWHYSLLPATSTPANDPPFLFAPLEATLLVGLLVYLISFRPLLTTQFNTLLVSPFNTTSQTFSRFFLVLASPYRTSECLKTLI